MRRIVSSAALAVILAGCVPAAPPPPAPAPAPPPPAPVTPPPVPLGQDWNDWPVTPGTWTYRREARGSAARFGAVGAGTSPLATLRCDRDRRVVELSIQGAPGSATVTTTSMTRAVPLQPGAEPGTVSTALQPSDRLLDAIAFSRGRFVVAPAGGPMLVVPPFAEIGRVIEDCRG